MDKGPKTEEFLSDFFGVPASTFKLLNDKTKPVIIQANLKYLHILTGWVFRNVDRPNKQFWLIYGDLSFHVECVVVMSRKEE